MSSSQPHTYRDLEVIELLACPYASRCGAQPQGFVNVTVRVTRMFRPTFLTFWDLYFEE